MAVPVTLPRRRRVLGRFGRNPRALVGAVVLVVLAVVALAAARVAPYPPDIANFEHRLVSPSTGHLFGTDHLGRDVLSRTIWASRTSLTIGFLAAAIAVSLGVLVGAVSGYLGGWPDAALMRLTDMVLAFPVFFVAVMFLALFGSTIAGLVTVIGATSWPPTARLVRAEFLRLRTLDFVTAARSLGAPETRVMARHILPNIVAVIVISVTLRVGVSILAEASLSYLGLGVQPPTASWGNLVADGREYLRSAWWVSLFPGSLVFLSVMAFNLLGDGLRDAFDPRMRLSSRIELAPHRLRRGPSGGGSG
jgi:peptide/nickel transport system permease protein